MKPDRFVGIAILAALDDLARIHATFESAVLLEFQAGLLDPVGADETLAAGAAELEQDDDPILTAFLRAIGNALGEVGDFTAFHEDTFCNRNLALKAVANLVPGMPVPGREEALRLFRHDQHVVIGTTFLPLEQPFVRHLAAAALRDQALTPRHLGCMNYVHRVTRSPPRLRA